jgi:hypothetical protein
MHGASDLTSFFSPHQMLRKDSISVGVPATLNKHIMHLMSGVATVVRHLGRYLTLGKGHGLPIVGITPYFSANYGKEARLSLSKAGKLRRGAPSTLYLHGHERRCYSNDSSAI